MSKTPRVNGTIEHLAIVGGDDAFRSIETVL